MLFSFLISIIGRKEMLASWLRVACMSKLAVVRIAREKKIIKITLQQIHKGAENRRRENILWVTPNRRT